MADYIYLLENRLTPAQRAGVRAVREVARAKGLTVFLVGGAVRDLTTGSPVRDLDVVVQGSAPKLRKDLEKAGATVMGELDTAQALFLRFPGNVRMEVGSTLSITFPKPGKPIAKAANILEDLRRRDFTANAMALSLNEGSYGLLMDPLNGVADIENRQLRLVSAYGFIEDPVRMIRASRLMARLGWTLDEKTQARYETGKQEGYISALSEFHRGYETEEIIHEEDPLRVLKRLESEGWMKYLAPYWTSAKVNFADLEKLREAQAQLQIQGIQPDGAAASFPMLTAKLTPKEVATLKAGFPRQGFVAEIEGLEAEAKEFAGMLGGKAGSLPSQAWRLITSGRPEAVLWTAYSTKSPTLQAKFKSFATEWPAARQKMPYALMQEMRIVPELPEYDELLEKLFFELMDGKLGTAEEMKAFLEPYSPPAPPPPVNTRRARTGKKEAKGSKSRAKKVPEEDAEAVEDGREDGDEEHDADDLSDSKVEVASEEISELPMRTAPLEFVIPETAATEPAPESRPTKTVAKKSLPVAETPAVANVAAAKKPVAASVKAAAPAKKTTSAPVPSAKAAVTSAAPVKTATGPTFVAQKVAAASKGVKVVEAKRGTPPKKEASVKVAGAVKAAIAPVVTKANTAVGAGKGSVRAAAGKVFAKISSKQEKGTAKAAKAGATAIPKRAVPKK